MDKLEILKKAKEKVDALVADKNSKVESDSVDTEATKMAVMMTSVDAIISSINENKINPEEFRRVFEESVARIDLKAPEVVVNVPEIKVPEAKVTVTVPKIEIPEIKLPTINVPEAKVTVHVPEIKIPDVKVSMPDSMEVHGDVGFRDYGFDNPIPVQIRDANGKPLNLNDLVGGNTVSAGGARSVKINNTSAEPIPISGTISASFSADFGSGEIGSQTLRTVQATDAISSVYVTGANGTIGVVTINPDGNPVYSGGSSGGGLTDTELRASSVPVEQVSGSIWSTNVLTMPSVTVTSITNSTAVSIVDSTGVQYSGSNPVPVTTVPSAITATTVDATASGDNTIVAITNSPRLYYISLSANGANSADVTAIVKIGASSKYKVSLKAGAIWARHIGAGDRYITGSAGDDIIVNLSAVQTVHVSIEYADI